MRQHNGRIYRTGQASPLGEEVTAGYELTAGMDLTPAYGVFLGRQFAAPAPPPQPSALDGTKKALMVFGGVFFIVLMCALGLFLAGSTVCDPCTFGSRPDSDPAPIVTVNATSPYDPVAGCGTEDTP